MLKKKPIFPRNTEVHLLTAIISARNISDHHFIRCVFHLIPQTLTLTDRFVPKYLNCFILSRELVSITISRLRPAF
jgi:hypothetical protein